MTFSPIFMGDLIHTDLELDRSLKIYTLSTLDLHPKEYPSIIKSENTDLRVDKMMRYEGNGAPGAKTEGDKPAITSMREGFIEQGTQTTFAHDMPITWEARRFAVKEAKIVNQMGEYQGRSGILRYEFTSVSPINNGTSVSVLGGDGQPYFSASHRWKSTVATYSNLLNAAELSWEALKDAYQVISNATMEYDIPGAVKPNMIHIGTDNMFALPEILESEKDPTSANNTVNILKQKGLKMNLNHYLSDRNAWTVDSMVPTRILLVAAPIELSSYMDEPTRNLNERLFCSIGTRFQDVVNTYHNQGS